MARLRPTCLVTTHVGPDFDGLAAMFAAQKLWPEALPVVQGRIEASAREFLALHRDLFRVHSLRDVDTSELAQLIVCDAGSASRIGELQPLLKRSDLAVKVYDHRPQRHDRESFPPHAELMVRPYGALTTAMVELLRERSVPIAPAEATLFAIGIAADTGNLSFMSVTPNDFYAMGYLHECGAQPDLVQRFLILPLDEPQRALLQSLETTLHREPVGGASVALASAEPHEPFPEVAHIVRHLLQATPDDAIFALVAMNDRLLVVGRSRSPAIDCLQTLEPFGGGGHPGAASATVARRPCAEVEAQLLAQLRHSAGRMVTARDIMSTPVQSISGDATIGEAHQAMLRSGHSGLLVLGAARQLIGVISRRDLDKALGHGLGTAPVRAYMSRNVVTANDFTPLTELSALIAEHNVGRLPILAHGTVVGIVTRSDVIRMLHLEGRSRDEPLLHDVDQPRIAEGLGRLPAPLRSAIEQAASIGDELGVAVYLVGGIVRDFWLGRSSTDVDLVIQGDALQVARKLAHQLELPVEFHPRFSTARIDLPASWGAGEHLDLVTARGEWYAHPGALPQVQPGGVFDDALRRDFTINAMALCLNGPPGRRGRLSDPWKGLSDLSAGLIRVLHPLSFVDDPTRIFRAVRFAARYGFSLEPHTEDLLRGAVAEGRLASISPQRVRSEIELLCAEEHPGRSLLLAAELGIWSRLHPGWEPIAGPLTKDDVLETHLSAWRTSAAACAVSREELALACLFGGLPSMPRKTLTERFAFDRNKAALLESIEEQGKHTRVAVSALFDAAGQPPLASAVHRVLASVPAAALVFFDLVWDAQPAEREMVRRELSVTRNVQLEVRGEDLLAAGMSPGSALGHRLALTLAAKQDGLLTTREEELSFALR